MLLVFRLLLQPLRESDPIFQGPQGGGKGAAQAFVQRDTHHFGRVGMAYVTAELNEVPLVDLPHHTVAIRAGEYGTPPELIHPVHPVHIAGLSACDLHFERDAVGNLAGFSGWPMSETGEQRR
jgi:hypothetical protein